MSALDQCDFALGPGDQDPLTRFDTPKARESAIGGTKGAMKDRGLGCGDVIGHPVEASLRSEQVAGITTIDHEAEDSCCSLTE